MPYHITVDRDDRRREIVIHTGREQREAAVILLSQLMTTLRSFEQSVPDEGTQTGGPPR
jgi:hypothetical protein